MIPQWLLPPIPTLKGSVIEHKTWEPINRYVTGKLGRPKGAKDKGARKPWTPKL